MREGKEIEVEQGKYKKARAPHELYSGGLVPCIAIGAIYNKKGYMLHDTLMEYKYSSKCIEPLFADLLRDVKNKSGLRIYVCGGGIEVDDEAESAMREARQAVIDKIGESGFEKCVGGIRWCPTRCGQSLRLILSESRAEIEEEDYILGSEEVIYLK